jgi:hypothetical protein
LLERDARLDPHLVPTENAFVNEVLAGLPALPQAL